MKKNQNNLKNTDYYIGLDIGTNSVGWAATDSDYNILKLKEKAMWGTRLFDEAQGAEERRGYRTDRRRIERRKQRLTLLEALFGEEISCIDNSFFVRLKESSLDLNDKKTKDKFLIFNDLNYTDKDYLREYPTIYHLRSELVHSKEPHDIRLVFLALHHIIKHRGHFLFETKADVSEKKIVDWLCELNTYVSEKYGCEIKIANIEKYCEILEDKGSFDVINNNIAEIIKKSTEKQHFPVDNIQ